MSDSDSGSPEKKKYNFRPPTVDHSGYSAEFLNDVRQFKLVKESKTSHSTYTALPYWIYPDTSFTYLLDYFEYDIDVNVSDTKSFITTNLEPKVRKNHHPEGIAQGGAHFSNFLTLETVSQAIEKYRRPKFYLNYEII